MSKQHTCAICSRQFKRKAELDRHGKRQTPCRPPTHQCDRCGKGMSSYQTLWRHKKACKEVKGTLVEPLQETDNLRAEKAIIPCQWLKIGFTEYCNRLGTDKYCHIHRRQLRKRVDYQPSTPCRKCGVGTLSEPRLCLSCGAPRIRTALIYKEAAAKRLFKKVMKELSDRYHWYKLFPVFI